MKSGDEKGVESWHVGNFNKKNKHKKSDEIEEGQNSPIGCWGKWKLTGTCFSSRSKVDTSISGISTHCESKSTNDTSKDQPVTQIVSSTTTTSTVESNSSTQKLEDELKIASRLRKFAFNDLKMATRNFRPESLLGEGGFGCVFKGWIEENGTAPVKPGTGLTVAVKTLNHDGLQGHKEWLAEVNYLGDLIHPNLVKLIGYCIEDDQRLLAYEFMPRGSLENHLFRRSLPLPWSIRMKIALGAAKGLAFLHEEAKRPVIYRDFKTSNILLDAEYNAKLSDFGLAKDAPEGDKTHVSTRVMGTYGYAAPEYVMTSPPMAPITTSSPPDYNRLTELKQFDDSKLGVKGLLDTGITTIPRIFHHPPEDTLPPPNPNNRRPLSIPVINLHHHKSTLVDQIKHSSSTFGFFQIVNHSVPVAVIDSLVGSMKVFFEESSEYKMRYYHREVGKGAAYSTNFDLFRSKAASWRDSLQVRMSPMEPNWEAVPEMCREALAEWDKAAVVLAEELMSILCEGLGIKNDRLKDLTCLEGRVSVAHYYPPCPQPELTVGLTSHTDPGVLTMVVQNEVGGLLQVKCGDEWADVEAVPGAIVVNIGDLLQMMSNDEYKSAQHRVLANPAEGARVSIATFFNPSIRDKLYGPFPELVSTTKPAVYRDFVYEDYMRRFFTKELDGKTLTNFYKIDDSTKA